LDLRIIKPIQPVVELLARIMRGPVRLKPNMLVAEVIEAYASLTDWATAWSVTLEVALWGFHYQSSPKIKILQIE
jgi:hypothetical protein